MPYLPHASIEKVKGAKIVFLWRNAVLRVKVAVVYRTGGFVSCLEHIIPSAAISVVMNYRLVSQVTKRGLRSVAFRAVQGEVDAEEPYAAWESPTAGGFSSDGARFPMIYKAELSRKNRML